MGIDAHGSCQASALVHIQSDKALLPFSHRVGLLLKRKEQVLLQSHIQKSPDFGHILDLQLRCLAHLQFWLSRGGNQAVR